MDVLPDHHHVGITAPLIHDLGPLKYAVGRGWDWLPLTLKLIAPRRPEAA
jgi:hypothetical protein